MKKLFFLLALVILMLGFTKYQKSYSQVYIQDSIALVALYNSTDGQNWTCDCNLNWLTTPVSQWQGITVENNRVIGIQLSGGNMSCTTGGFCGLNGVIPHEIWQLTELQSLDFTCDTNLSGEIPQEINNLLSLTVLRMAYCNLSGAVPSINNLTSLQIFDIRYNRILDLPVLPSLPALNMAFSHNRLTFEDFEPNMALSMDYSPQDSVCNNIDTVIHLNNTVSIVTTVGGTHNYYQWYHNGNAIINANDSILTINNFTTADTGKYICSITNSIVPNLTLWRRTIYLRLDTLNSVKENLLFDFDIRLTDKVIEINSKLSDCNAALYTYDGKFLLNVKLLKDFQNNISLNNLPKGVLMLKINNEKNILIKKIMNH